MMITQENNILRQLKNFLNSYNNRESVCQNLIKRCIDSTDISIVGALKTTIPDNSNDIKSVNLLSKKEKIIIHRIQHHVINYMNCW